MTERDKRHLIVIIHKERRAPAQKVKEIFTDSTGKEVSKNTL